MDELWEKNDWISNGISDGKAIKRFINREVHNAAVLRRDLDADSSLENDPKNHSPQTI